MKSTLGLSFLGAARTVTGSRHLIRFGGRSVLFDCGLFQGHRDEAERINRTFQFEPGGLDAVVVSHAHLDHTGNLPTLSAQGFSGPIHVTSATADLARVMLADSAFLMQKDVEHVNRHARAGRTPRQPLYTPHDVEATLGRFETHGYHERWTVLPGMTATYSDAGHILGSAVTTIEFEANGRSLRLCMGGDLGRPRRPILRDPETPPAPDVLVLESTYGDRRHAAEAETLAGLADAVQRTAARGGRVLVPAFAVGRTQELVATLHELIQAGRVPDLPMFVDSPMARNATAIFTHHPECFDEQAAAAFGKGDGEPFGFGRLRYVATPEESRALNDRPGPCIIISASGMCEGGRVLHHLQHTLGDERNTVLFVGFQGEGTLGRRLRDGAETVNVFGEPVRVRAEIAALDGFSAHADQQELLDWVGGFERPPGTIFLVHGEPGPAETLAALLRARTPAQVHVPVKGQEFELWN
ncbi:MAG TPA: MBL fold metallo-hydrolase [Candidatus Acidoferrales bacterium]|nr:MBL fold metallo-hydrolase [Candidatus Acidoferrales bacterium]